MIQASDAPQGEEVAGNMTAVALYPYPYAHGIEVQLYVPSQAMIKLS